MFTKAILVLIPLLGLIVGYILRKIAPEEVTPGKPYFIMFQRILLAAIVGILLYISPWTWKTILILFLGAGVGYLIRVRYLYVGLAMLIGLLVSQEILLLLTALLFLYGLPFGTHMITKKPIIAFMSHAILYALPFLLLLTPFSVPYLPAFIAGALFLRE